MPFSASFGFLVAGLALGWIGLGGCADQPPADPLPAVPEVETAEIESPDVEGTESPERSATLPGAVLGTFDVDAAQCAEQTTMARLVTMPDTLRFYYGYATVDSVAAQGDGYRVDATMYQLEGAVEVVPEPTTVRIEPTDQGVRLDVASTRAGVTELVRCTG